jgi:flagellar motor switch protein FliM
MSNAILSQEEIDALLNSMDKGEVDLETDKSAPAETQSYDLTSPSVTQKEEFDALKEVNEKFTRHLRNTFEGLLQTTVKIQLAANSIVQFDDIRKAHPFPSGLGIFSMDPLNGKGLVIFEPRFFFMLLDRLAGGTGLPVKKAREFTVIETNIMQRLFTSVLADLEKAWQVVQATRVTLEKVESNPDFLHIADNADRMLVKQYDLQVNTSSAAMHLCFPYHMLGAIRHELSSHYLQSKNMKQAHTEQLKQQLRLTTVTVTAELGKSLQTVRDILHLKKGDIITLDQGPQDLVSVSVESITKFKAIAGVAKGNRAVHISEVMH